MGTSNNTRLYCVSESWRQESKAISGMGTVSGEDPLFRVPPAESGLGNKTDSWISVFTCLCRMLINANKTKVLGHMSLRNTGLTQLL